MVTSLTKRQLVLLSDLSLIMVAILWGSSYSMAKISLAFYPVLGFLTVRFGLTSLLLLPTLWRSYQKNTVLVKQSFKTAVPLGVLLWVVFIFETYAVLYTSVAHVAFLISLCLIITPFFEWLFIKNKPPMLVFFCAGLSLVGTYLLVMPTNELTLNLGDGLVLLAAFCRALLVVFSKKAMQHHDITAINLTSIQSFVVFIASALLFFIVQLGSSQPLALPSETSFWLATGYLVIFCTILAFFIQNWAINIGSPSRASLLMGSEPLFGALFAVLFFNEQISLLGWFGGSLIVLGSVLMVTTKSS